MRGGLLGRRQVIIFLMIGWFLTEGARAQLVQEAIPPRTDRSDLEYVTPQTDTNQLTPRLRSRLYPEVEDSESEELAGGSLALADVIASVYRYFPQIQEARLEAGVADGRVTSAMGAYDLMLHAGSMNQPSGFYRTYRQGLGAVRRTWWGGYVSAGYRIGRGQFEPWYKERETNRGGEMSMGLGMPLLQGRAIDPERVAVFQAGLAQQAVGPTVQNVLLDTSRDASVLYWEWVAAGARLMAQDELLSLARERQDQLEFGARAGEYPQIDVVFNRQLVAERASRRLEAEQRFRLAGFRLSLFLRDEAGSGLIPNDQWLPLHFPIIEKLPPADFNADFQAALTRRPELAILALQAQHLRLDRQLADNQRLPTLDLMAEASQDVGAPVSPLNDKGQFELLMGVRSDLPLQRRNAVGRIQQANAKLSQIDQKIRLQRDKIAIELQSAYNSLVLSAQRVEQMETALEAAFRALQSFRFGFQRGMVNLVQLNILETQTNEVEILLIDAQRDWFNALAQMQAALGLDPLEQAINVTALPESTRLGPGDMLRDEPENIDELEADWQKLRGRSE
jgi:outer membrane protein TolC